MNNNNQINEQKIPTAGIYIIPVVIAAIIKIWLLTTDSIPFNADEAIVALMARHINKGEWPIFFYGQAYMGSLDAILVATGFKIFGEQVWVIRVIQCILYLGTVFTLTILGKKLLGSNRAALFTGLFAAIPPVNTSLYTTVSLGGYGETLLLGNLLLLGGVKIIDILKSVNFQIGARHRLFLFTWAVMAGFSFWVFGLSLVYSIPVVLVTLKEIGRSKNLKTVWSYISILLLGGIIGALPWIMFALQRDGAAVITELAGGAIANPQSPLYLLQPLKRFGNFLLLGGTVILGFRPPWGIRWLMLPILPFVMIFWLSAIFNSVRKLSLEDNKAGLKIIGLLGPILVVGFVFSPYGGDPSGRYFLPLIVPISLLGAEFLHNHIPKNTYLPVYLLIIVLVYNLGGNIQSVLTNPPGLTTQFDSITQVDHREMDELIEFLQEHNLTGGYSNYWVSYPLAFLSEEKLVFQPRLPYHEDFRYTARDDRYPPYSQIVNNTTNIGYITTNHQALDDFIRTKFSAENITWNEKIIGDYQIFYDLSRDIRPQEIGLGRTTNP